MWEQGRERSNMYSHFHVLRRKVVAGGLLKIFIAGT